MVRLRRLLNSANQQDPSDLTEDRISSLPWNVLDIIFSYLSLLESIRTSVLSKKWKNHWLSVSDFILDSEKIFDELNFQKSRNLRDGGWYIIASIINKFLLHHTSSIRTFSLSANCNAHYSDMYQWIKHLSKLHVETFSLEELGLESFVMSSYLFLFQKLEFLFLRHCTLQVPCSFGRFNYLRALFFRSVAINDDDLNRLIRSCPVMEEIALLNMIGVKILIIHAPILRSLLVDSTFEDIVIQYAPSLVVAKSIPICEPEGRVININSYSIIRSFLGLGSLLKLGLSGDIIQFLAADYADWNFQRSNTTLSYLSLDRIRFENVEVIRVCLSLLSCCTNLRFFRFTIESAKGAMLIKQFLKDNNGRFTFPSLHSIEMMFPGGVDMKCTVNFIEFVDAHSPNLEYITIWKNNGTELTHTRVCNLIHRLRRKCSHSRVSYMHMGPDNQLQRIYYH